MNGQTGYRCKSLDLLHPLALHVYRREQILLNIADMLQKYFWWVVGTRECIHFLLLPYAPCSHLLQN